MIAFAFINGTAWNVEAYRGVPEFALYLPPGEVPTAEHIEAVRALIANQ